MGRHNRNRWVPPSTVSNPERGAPPIQNPETDEEQLEQRTEPGGDEDEDEDDVEAQRILAERLAAARALPADINHWPRIWTVGRDFAVTKLEEGASLAEVQAERPPDAVGCRDCWTRGRDAALRVIQEA